MSQALPPEVVSPWDVAASTARRTRVVEDGAVRFTLREPESSEDIVGLALSGAKAEILASTISAEVGSKIEGSEISVFRLIAGCCDEPPTMAQIGRLSVRRGGLYNALKMAAMDLCGLMDTDAAMEEAEGN